MHEVRGEESVGDSSFLQLFRIVRRLCDPGDRVSLLPNADLVLDNNNNQPTLGEDDESRESQKPPQHLWGDAQNSIDREEEEENND